MVQLSHLYLTTGKTIALSRRTLVGIVMSLLFNMLSSLVIAFLPRSKHLLISWLQSLSVVILEPKKIKSVTVSTVSPSICHEVMGPDAMILAFWILSFKPALLKVELQALLLLLILEKLSVFGTSWASGVWLSDHQPVVTMVPALGWEGEVKYLPAEVTASGHRAGRAWRWACLEGSGC